MVGGALGAKSTEVRTAANCVPDFQMRRQHCQFDRYRENRTCVMKHRLFPAIVLLTLITSVFIFSPTTFAQSTDQVAVVSAQGGVLQGAEQQTLGPLVPGALLSVQGRSADSQFLYVQTEDRRRGWVDVRALLVVNVNKLPIVEMADPTDTMLPATELLTTTTITTMTTNSNSQPTTLTLLATPIAPIAANGGTTLVATPASAISAIVTLTDSRLNLRGGPSAAYAVVAKAEPGSRWAVKGQTKAGDWLQLQSLTGDEGGWAAMAYLQIEGGGALPVITDFPAVPTAAANAMASTDRILLPTPAALTTIDQRISTDVTAAAPSVAAGKTGLSGLLAFQDRNGGTIYLYDLNQDTLRPLTGGIDPAISPDGRRVAFTRDGGEGGLYVINSDGSGEQRIYNDHPLLRAPSWSPDGQWIVFSRANGFEDCRVVRGSVCLPDDAILDSLPEGLRNDAETQNMVKGIPNQRTYHTSLSRIAPDGGGYRDIPALDYAAAPDWNANGIVYQSNAGIQRTADESDVRTVEIANDPLTGYFHDPDWQPGPKGSPGRIVFHRKQGSHWQIYGVNPDGSGLAALTRPVTALVDELPSNVSPAWSPDGQQIIYLSNRNSIESAGAWHFWVMNADGSEQRLLPIDVVLDYTFSSEQMVSWAVVP